MLGFPWQLPFNETMGRVEQCCLFYLLSLKYFNVSYSKEVAYEEVKRFLLFCRKNKNTLADNIKIHVLFAKCFGCDDEACFLETFSNLRLI